MAENPNLSNSELPKMAMKEIPVPKNNAQPIVSLVRKSGKITGYKLSDGQVLNRQEGVALAKQGGIKGVGIAERNGKEYLKSIPDENDGNNLGNLPSVTQ